MLLTIDIGNSNIVFSLSGAERRLYRLDTVPDWTTEDYLPRVKSLFAREKIDISEADGAVLCSVVPSLIPVLSQVVRQLMGLTPYVITPASRSGLTLAIAPAPWRRRPRPSATQRWSPSRAALSSVPPP